MMRVCASIQDELTHQQAGDKEVVTQLQEKLRQLETSDTVLRARQQHDAVVRYIKKNLAFSHLIYNGLL